MIQANQKSTFRLGLIILVVLVAYVAYDKFLSDKKISLVTDSGEKVEGEIKETSKTSK